IRSVSQSSLFFLVITFGSHGLLSPRSPNETQYSFLKAWGTLGTGRGQFNHTAGVAVDPQGRYVYVADFYNNRIQVGAPSA
ncbi:MAG TPA: hypothetical protein VE692_06970, partial [Nitrososphaera sp.]|nr:hypothetical protein [Nitrososphaera sp.]